MIPNSMHRKQREFLKGDSRNRRAGQQNYRQQRGSVCVDAGEQVVGDEKDREQGDHRHVRRKAFHVRGDAVCKPLDEADAVQSIAKSDQGAEPREGGPGALVIRNIAPSHHPRDQH